MKPYRFDRSLEIYQEARRYLAGGVSSHFRSLGRPHPMFFTEGSGVTVRDVDGNEYLDFTLSQGPLLVRAVTGRRTVVRFEGHYHGWYDSIYVNVRPTREGGFEPALQSGGQSAA